MPDATAPAVQRLVDAGWSIAGKANLHEFAYGITSNNPHHGLVPNPLVPGRIAGGSSGGNAAALVLGEADGALGTDTAGSIRIPSACCGITGFKPTHGLVPLDGCFPLAPSYDHAGPMALDVETCEAMLVALVPGFAPAPAPDLSDLRVGVAWADDAEPLVRARVNEAAACFGAAVPVSLPLPPPETYMASGRETAVVHATLFAEHREAYGDSVARKLDWALTITDAQAEAAQRAREAYRERVVEELARHDLLITPTMAMVAPALGDELSLRDGVLRLTYPFNAAGVPALALPCGPAEDGLPASAQLVGPAGADAFVLAAGRALQAALRD